MSWIMAMGWNAICQTLGSGFWSDKRKSAEDGPGMIFNR